MCESYVNLPQQGPNAPLRAEREVRYKAYTPKIYQKCETEQQNTAKE